ncbi:NDUBB dehydrogenase, partial [Nothocercus julius]|nr:NDUBB dehydrogenase [Nothocercus julius]
PWTPGPFWGECPGLGATHPDAGAPPRRLQQWARREAERQIRAREAQGLPLVTPQYYDPARLPLPPTI